MKPILLLLALLLGAACSGADTPSAALRGEPLVIRAGTSFGMCLGYCATEMRIDGREIVFTRTGTRDAAAHPPQTERVRISETEWAELMALADARAFAGLREVYGCPDCADGGAEWVEVERGGQARRVTFEYGAQVPEIQPLVEKLRQIRARLQPADR